MTVARRFHSDQRRPRYRPVKALGIALSVHQFALARFSCLRVQPTNLLPAGMKITPYNHHCEGSFLSEKPLVLKPRLPGLTEPSLLSNQLCRAFCERVGDSVSCART